MSKNTYAAYSLYDRNQDINIYDSTSQTRDPYKFKSDFDPLAELAKELLKDKTQKPHGNVYVATTCKIPRDKMKAYFQENNLKKTTRTYLADTVLVDLESLDKVIGRLSKQYNWSKGIMVSSEDVIKNKHLFKITHTTQNSWNEGYFKTHDQVLEGKHDVFIRYSNDTALPQLQSLFPEAELVETLSYPTGDLLKTLELLTFLKSHPNVTVVFDTALNENMTNDGIELEADIEEQIVQMLKSRDINDTKMAIEIMSNFDLEKSLFRIANIMNQYRSRFVGKQSMLAKTSYKQIDTYIRSKGINWMSDRDNFLDDMFKLYSKDEKAYPVLKNYIQQYLQYQLKRTGIKITDISLAQ
jgi:hypothetical protein